MKILVYFGHPAQYLFLRATIKRMLQSDRNKVVILIKTKDVLESLLVNDQLPFINILPKERANSKFSIALSLLRRNLKIIPILIREKPDLLISTDASIAQMGMLFNINRITVTEDDYSIIKRLGDLTYPFTQTILCPNVCEVGRWNNKKIGYEGYMKLAYLHPNVLKLSNEVVENYQFPKKFAIIRLAKLTAHHDFGIKGINNLILDNIIKLFENKAFRVYISSEGELSENYKNYQLKINPNDMHNVLAKSSFLICDSQSMSVEASMLGIPSIRFSSFAGKISVLEELENEYGLTFGVNPMAPEKLFTRLEELLDIDDLREIFQLRRKKMLSDKIEVTDFLIWFIENYPESRTIMMDNPEYQNKFKYF